MNLRFISGILLVALLSAPLARAQITFTFNYTYSGGAGVGFGDATLGAARQTALNDAATTLAGFFTTAAPRNITFTVDSYVTNNSTLASAGSNISSSAGFNQTVVQQKVISGTDSNGATADGNISWNWHHTWDITNSVAGGAYDFKSTVMHEILHAFGFSSTTNSAGNNTGTSWNTFDRFVTNSAGVNLVDLTTFNFVTAQNGALTDNGMYISGPNAMAANNGNRVSIFSPSPWSDGSSGSHTADSVYPNTMMIAATVTGQGARTLTAIEVGILQDIGYTMTAIPEPSTYAAIIGAAALGVTAIRRRRRIN